MVEIGLFAFGDVTDRRTHTVNGPCALALFSLIHFLIDSRLDFMLFPSLPNLLCRFMINEFAAFPANLTLFTHAYNSM